MPKREKTPPPPEDEPRYLVVVHPYPLNPNFLMHADRRTLALWLACCTGKDALYAMFYKPASPGMVIIEVDRYFDRFDSLLGRHDWSSFLKHPTDEDQGKSSKVFWCHYNDGRKVQKNGWKRVDVEEHWFQGWSPNNAIIKHPYPKTAYCDVPAEAQTGVPLCRPLPKETFTLPPPRPRPTVGSAEWINSRSTRVASEAPSSSRRQRGPGSYGSQIAPSDSASIANSGIGARAHPPQRAHVSQWLTNQRAIDPVWPRAPSTISSSFTLSSSTASSSVGSRTPSALGVTRAAAPPPSRPSVSARPSGSVTAESAPSLGPYESLDWSDEVEIAIQQDDIPTSPQSGASTSRPPGGRTAPPRRAPEPRGPIDPDQDYEYEEEDLPRRSTADAMKAIFDGAPGVASGLHDLEEEEEEAVNYVAWNYPQAVGLRRDWTPAGGDELESENPWEGYDAPRREAPTKVNIKGGEEWICPEHGSTCNPGICKACARVEAMRRWAKEHEKREEAKAKRKEKAEKAREKKDRKFASYRYRGAGGSGSDREDSGSQPSDSPAGSETPPPFSPQDGAATPLSPPGLRQSIRGTRGTTSLPTTSTSARGTSSQPAPEQTQSVSNTRSTASAWTTTTSTGPDVDAQGNGRQRDRGPSQSSSVSSEPRSPASNSRVPTSPLFHPVDGGFPTFADTTWGDPIAAAQSASTRSNYSTSGTRSAASRSAVGADMTDGQAGEDNGRGNVEAGQEQDSAGQNDRTGRGRRGNRRGRRGTARRTATAPAAPPSQDVAHPNVLDVTLPPGGPGEQWCSGNVEW